MSDKRRFESRRARTALGISVVAVALAATGVLGGVGFARSSVSAAQYQYGKVTICHKTHSKKHPAVTISISLNAWPAHRRHGDTLGACGANGGTTTSAAPTTTTTTTSTTTTSTSQSSGPGRSGDHGKPGGAPPGNGQGHGKKKP